MEQSESPNSHRGEHTRRFRFCRSPEHAHLQFQPFADCRAYRDVGSEEQLESFRTRWKEMEDLSAECYHTARELTAELSNPEQYLPEVYDVHTHPYIEALKNFNKKLPVLNCGWEIYGFTVLGDQHVDIGQRELPADEEAAQALIEATLGNLARITLLKGARLIAFYDNGGLRLLCDTQTPEWEVKSCVTVYYRLEGRWANFYASVIACPFAPSYYTEVKPGKKWSWLGRKKRPELGSPTKGDWLELYDYGLHLAAYVRRHNLGEPYYLANDASTGTKQAMQRYIDEQNRFINKMLESCKNAAQNILSETQRGAHQMGAGPRPDMAGGFGF